MRLSYLVIAILSACSVEAQTINAAGRIQDLNFIALQVPELDPYFFVHLDRSQFQNAVDNLKASVAYLSDAEFYTGLAQLLAMAGDTHTSLSLNDPAAAARGFRAFPLQFRWLDDGIFVTGAAAGYAQALGTKLVAVGELPIDDVVGHLAAVISHESDSGLHAMVQTYLRGQQILQGLGIVPNGATSDLTFETLAGDRFTLAVSAAAEPMTGAPDPRQGYMPDYLALPNIAYWGRYVQADRLLYFKYNACVNGPTPFASFAANLLGALDSSPTDTVLIDFRGNPGGDSAVMQPLVDGLRQRMSRLLADPNFRIYAAFDKNTFSSAHLNAMYLKSPDLDRGGIVQFIGEPTGEPPAGFGNVARFTLPSSGLTGQYATLAIPPPSWIPSGPVLAPDIAVSVRSTDYFARFDPVMAAVLARTGARPEAPSGRLIALNGASFRPDQGLAPGSLAAAFAEFSAAPDEILVADAPGKIVAAGVSQVNFIIPDSVTPGRVTISARADGVELASGQATVTATGPAIFVLRPTDPAQPGAVRNQDDSINSQSNPAASGSVVQIFGTGMGSSSDAVRAFANNTPAQVLYSGVVLPGLWQINVRLPDGISGEVSLFVTAGNLASNATTFRVQ